MATSSKPSRGASRFRLIAAALLVLMLVGCGRGDMSGKVTFQGKPVVFGTVMVHGKDGLRQGAIQPDGSFTVHDIATGEARVSVNSPNPKSIDLYPNKNPNFKQEPYPDVPGWFAIPGKYGEVETSGLTYTIRGGNNAIDIELKKPADAGPRPAAGRLR